MTFTGITLSDKEMITIQIALDNEMIRRRTALAALTGKEGEELARQQYDEISNAIERLESERYADREDLSVDLIGKARRMAVNRDKNHPWKDMDDMELLKSAGLYEKNRLMVVSFVCHR